MFSSRLPASFVENALARARAESVLRGRTLIDLTESNPVRAGLSPGPRELESAFSGLAIASYDPDPRGLAVAREAIAAYEAARGHTVAPDRIIVTSSTSEAYAHLFRLLADPGDDVLVPQPSYPLFEPLAAIEGVKLRGYPLTRGDRWRVEADLARSAAGRRTRAVVAVDPNNPTGSVLDPAEREALRRLCADRKLALIRDEVFADFILREESATAEPAPAARPARRPAARKRPDPQPLTFTLSGLSKAVGLPQLKLAWITVEGPEASVQDALARLEWIADTFLSVGTPVQLALPRIFETRHAYRERTLQRLRGNLDRLRGALLAHRELELLAPEGGWSAVLRVPRVRSEEEWTLALLERGVAVHPGHFYDFPEEAYLVVSLLPEPAVFAEGIRRLITLE